MRDMLQVCWNRRLYVAALGLFVCAMVAEPADEAHPDAEQIVRNCVRQMSKSIRLESEYTYKILDETRNLNRSGVVKDTHRTLTEVVYFAGKPFERTLEKDGKPLKPNEEKREQEKMDRAASEAAKLTEEQREKRQAKLDEEREKDSEWFEYFPEAYTLAFEPETILNGRGTYVLKADPKPDYRGKYAHILTKARCKLFIDKTDFTLARIEADVLQPITFGLFLAKLSEGAHLSFEQVRVNDEVWLPKDVSVHANARALVKTFRFDEHLEFSDYRKFQSESKIVSVNEK